jgi:hypothetical protein
MNTTTALALLPTSRSQDRLDFLTALSLRRAATDDRVAWGSCEIRLVADRVASLRSGSTHKVYRDWRFAVIMTHGHPASGTTLCTIPIDPAPLVARQTHYALLPRDPQGARGAAGAAAFSWSSAASGAADPVAAALEQAHQVVRAAGWVQDATVPTCFTKPDPTARGRGVLTPPKVRPAAQPDAAV